MKNSIPTLICQHYIKELTIVLENENIQDIQLYDYLPVCINRKNKSALTKLMDESNDYCQISDLCILTRSDLGETNSSLQQEKKLYGNCLEMLIGKELLDFYASDGGYLVSPGWLSNWQQNLKEWGFNQESAKQFFSEFAKQIILLDTGIDPNSKNNLFGFSDYLEIPSQTIPIGLEHFRLYVLNKINSLRFKEELAVVTNQNVLANQQVADYALAFDLVTNLTRMMNEFEAIREIDNTFKMLFSPKETLYISLDKNKLINFVPHDSPINKVNRLVNWINDSTDDFFVNETQNSFFIRISHQSETLGAAEITNIAFPQYFNKYLNMALSIAPLFGLAISKARTYQQLEDDEVKLQKLASTDSLTGLYNRRFLLTALDNEFSRSKRYHSSLSAVMLDIDHFKWVNDNYGHAVGDQVLCKFAATITENLRKSDIAARLGGDEFIILLPETNQENAMLFSNRLRNTIEQALTSYQSGPVSITTSIGVAENNIDCNTPEDLLHHCDKALYNAKNKGRNLVTAWEK